ncbi:MAG: class E sortase [Clostridia bacterium]
MELAKKKNIKKQKFFASSLIAIGVILIVYFLFLNYSGRIYQMLYGFYYDNFPQAQTDSADNFFSYEDLPGILTFGQDFLPSQESPSMNGSTSSSGINTSAAAVEKKPKLPVAVLDFIKPINYSKRSSYKDFDMALIVPRMGLRSRVVGGVSTRELKQGPGLYDISALPNSDQGNVLIAAHRDVYGAWFYNIDKLRKGDKLKLYFGDKIYVYLYKDTHIVEPTDWKLLKEKGDPMLVLTSCDPKGTSKRRIVARATLTEVLDR